MMRPSLAILVLLVIVVAASSKVQAQDVAWADRMGGAGEDDGYGIAALSHDGDVRQVVAYHGCFGNGHAGGCAGFFQHGQLFFDADAAEGDAEFLSANLHSLRTSAGDHRDGLARPLPVLDARAITDVEFLYLLAAGGEDNPAVGHHAVNVQYKQLDPAKVCCITAHLAPSEYR